MHADADADRPPADLATSTPVATLPPGQRALARFPRFGTHLGKPAPAIPDDPAIAIRGPGIEPVDVPLTTLAELARTELRADFHCVAGWSATDITWEGVRFDVFYRACIEPVLAPGTVITHVVFSGLDGFRSTLLFEDAMADRVLLAQRLDGRPLGTDHGAPVRLVSPDQYGYMSTKHLCGIEVHTEAPEAERGSIADRLLESHPRARVAHEERHGSLPGWLVRPFYRALKAPLLYVCARGEQDQVATPTTITPTAKTSMLVRRPVHDVYEAFVEPAETTKFWFTKSTGRLDENDRVRWDWEMYDVHSDVEVVEIVPDERIVITWSGYQARERVEWTFTDRGDGTTYVAIEHSGFVGEPAELAEQAVNATEGFAYALAGAKAWLEHGLELNLVADKFPDHRPGSTSTPVWEHNGAPRQS